AALLAASFEGVLPGLAAVMGDPETLAAGDEDVVGVARVYDAAVAVDVEVGVVLPRPAAVQALDQGALLHAAVDLVWVVVGEGDVLEVRFVGRAGERPGVVTADVLEGRDL